MISEKIPAIADLSPEEKLILAGELWTSSTDHSQEQPDPQIVALLQERLAQYQANPEAVSPWSEVKERILSQQ